MRKVGKYHFLERLGHGGMGIVYLAKAEGSQGWNRNYAIKQMLPEMAKYLDYFTSEAHVSGKLSGHANIVDVVDYFVDEEGRHNIVMEYIEGKNVAELISKYGCLAPPVAVYIARMALRGLAYIHSAYLGPNVEGPLVHRDLSPDNIMVSNGADVKIADFGIAKARGLRAETQADLFRGKVGYASPEQLLAKPLDGRADVYQIGVDLYEMLSGRPAFPNASSAYHQAYQIAQIVDGKAQPLGELVPTVKPELLAAVATLMHKDRDQRPYAEDARALLKKACPECDDAEAELSRLVREMTKTRRRATSTWNIPGEQVTPPAPPQAGVILTALPEMETVKNSPAEQLAAVAKHEQTVSGRKSVAPANGVPIAVPREMSPREVNAPMAEMPVNRYSPLPSESPRTEVLDPPPRKRRFSGPVLAVVTSLLLLVVGVAAAVYKGVREQRPAPPAPAPVMTKPANPTAQKEPPLPESTPPTVASVAAPPAALAPLPSQETRKQERAPEQHPRSKSCKTPPPEGAGLIIADKEDQPVRVWVDDISIGTAPIQGYPVDPGKHQVTLERGDERSSMRTTMTVRVSAGHCYTVNRHAPSIASRAPAPAVPEPALPAASTGPQKTFKQLYDEAQDQYVKNACKSAQATARQAASIAPDRKRRSDAYRILAVASCCARDSAGVAEAWRYLDDYGHTFTRYVCGRYATALPSDEAR